MELSVIYEDNHLLVVDKPAGIATQGTDASMAQKAATYLKHRYHKPGNAFVGVVSRLDQLVSGVLLLARTSKAASRLSEQLRNRTVKKTYHACVEATLDVGDEWTSVEHWVRKNEARHRMQVVSPQSKGAQHAQLRFRTLAVDAASSLLEIDLLTGRKHQIRLQLAELGHPILGDSKYGSCRKFSRGIALHCSHLRCEHPTKKTAMEFAAPPIKHWQQIPRRMRELLADVC